LCSADSRASASASRRLEAAGERLVEEAQPVRLAHDPGLGLPADGVPGGQHEEDAGPGQRHRIALDHEAQQRRPDEDGETDAEDGRVSRVSDEERGRRRHGDAEKYGPIDRIIVPRHPGKRGPARAGRDAEPDLRRREVRGGGVVEELAQMGKDDPGRQGAGEHGRGPDDEPVHRNRRPAKLPRGAAGRGQHPDRMEKEAARHDLRQDRSLLPREARRIDTVRVRRMRRDTTPKGRHRPLPKLILEGNHAI
jgi:hypothetical protein